MHYYQHHIGDFIQATARLTDAQSMTYLRMLWLYYETEQPLPNNTKVIGLKVGADPEAVALILEVFFVQDGDLWSHKRCDAEIADYKAIRDRNRQNGKAGGRPKKTQWVSSGLPVETDTKPKGNPNQEPITNNQRKEKINQKEKPAAPKRDVVIPQGVSESTWADWLQLRKAKRAPVTQTALDQIAGEAVKAGWTLEQALAESIARGWTGFKADWLTQHAASAAPRRTQHQINAEATARALGYGQTNGSFFDVMGECHEVKADVAARLGGSDFQ